MLGHGATAAAVAANAAAAVCLEANAAGETAWMRPLRRLSTKAAEA